ncbi:MAG TPA: hypothetical protein VFW11_22385 [Cyclobacteriaceae bacterium]|nr:hypothetical protein [Cyclobacteriaceae bacterium]
MAKVSSIWMMNKGKDFLQWPMQSEAHFVIPLGWKHAFRYLLRLYPTILFSRIQAK